jgi:hypothetical protein
VAGLTGHGFKDLCQHRHQYVATPVGSRRSASSSTGSSLPFSSC